MKNRIKSLGIIVGLFFSINAVAQQSSGIDIQIRNQEAEVIFHRMTDVEADGAAGHIFKLGKSILCWRIDADIDDGKGKLIPNNDPRRYACSIHFTKNGLAEPGDPFPYTVQTP